MNTREFKIKCLASNTLCIYNYHIIIYDSDFFLVYDGYTNKLGYITFCPQYYKIYHFVIISPKIKNGLIHKCIVFTNSSCDTIIIEFSILEKISHSITLYLLDKNYENLKIEKGMIRLWPNHMK